MRVGNGSGSSRKVVRADPRFRARLLVFLALTVVLGPIAIFQVQGHLEDLRLLGGTDPAAAIAEARMMLLFIAYSGLPILLGTGFYVGRMGFRARRTAEFPPPGTPVVRDTVVTTGPVARRRGALLLSAGTLIAVVGIALPIAMNWVIDRLTAAPAS